MKHLYDKNGKFIGTEVDYEADAERRERQEERKQREIDRTLDKLDAWERRQRDDTKDNNRGSTADGAGAAGGGCLATILLIAACAGTFWLFIHFLTNMAESFAEGSLHLFVWNGFTSILEFIGWIFVIGGYAIEIALVVGGIIAIKYLIDKIRKKK